MRRAPIWQHCQGPHCHTSAAAPDTGRSEPPLPSATLRSQKAVKERRNNTEPWGSVRAPNPRSLRFTRITTTEVCRRYLVVVQQSSSDSSSSIDSSSRSSSSRKKTVCVKVRRPAAFLSGGIVLFAVCEIFCSLRLARPPYFPASGFFFCIPREMNKVSLTRGVWRVCCGTSTMASVCKIEVAAKRKKTKKKKQPALYVVWWHCWGNCGAPLVWCVYTFIACKSQRTEQRQCCVDGKKKKAIGHRFFRRLDVFVWKTVVFIRESWSKCAKKREKDGCRIKLFSLMSAAGYNLSLDPYFSMCACRNWKTAAKIFLPQMRHSAAKQCLYFQYFDIECV